MKRLHAILFFLLCSSFSCGPLPRPDVFQGSIGALPISMDVSGIVLTSSDSSYTSSDVYFYNFSTGQLSLLANGESGDVLAKWAGERLWLFNRATGRVSYSHFSPKLGAASRSVERRITDGLGGDPSDVVSLSDTELAVGLGAGQKVVIGNLASGNGNALDLGRVDTADANVPFRPGVLVSSSSDLLVFHQQLNQNWKAAGGGRVFISRKADSGSWSWVDQNPLIPGTQGVLLNISNPVTALKCEANSCLVAGTCYSTMGPACIGGIDEFDPSLKTVRHVVDIPADYFSAGPIRAGSTPDIYIACIKSAAKQNAEIAVVSLATGVIQKSWDASAEYCGAFQVDPTGKRIFAVKAKGSESELHVLDSNLVTLAVLNLPFVVTGMETVNE